MKLSLRSAVQTVQDGIRTQLWPLPILGIAVAIAAAILLPLLDVSIDAHLPQLLDQVVFNGDPGAARTVLSAVASSLITVTSLTFSLTVVTLQLASSQFSPRLLRTFTQDLFVQVTLAIFLATFTYSLTVLRSVRSAEEGGTAFVPRVAVTCAFLLALASVVALVLFLAHLTRQIRVETMLQRVRTDATTTIESSLTHRDSDRPSPPAPARPTEAEVVWARTAGFLTSVEQDDLVDTATELGAVVNVDVRPGAFVVQGTPLAHVWSSGPGPLDEEAVERLGRVVEQSVHVGPERTAAQDIGYGLRQITDIVNKALSPGINDPTTAVHALGHTASLLAELTNYDLGPAVVAGPDGWVRLVIDRPGFADLLEVAVSQPRSYGEADPQVLGRLYALLADVAWHARPEHHQPLLDQLRRLDTTTSEQDFDQVVTDHLSQLSDQARTVLCSRPRRSTGHRVVLTDQESRP